MTEYEVESKFRDLEYDLDQLEKLVSNHLAYLEQRVSGLEVNRI